MWARDQIQIRNWAFFKKNQHTLFLLIYLLTLNSTISDANVDTNTFLFVCICLAPLWLPLSFLCPFINYCICVSNKIFLNVNVHLNYMGILLNYNFCSVGLVWDLGFCISIRPGDTWCSWFHTLWITRLLQLSFVFLVCFWFLFFSFEFFFSTKKVSVFVF